MRTKRTPDLLDVLRHTENYEWPELPDGMVYGWRSTTPDLRSHDGFRWAFPGGWSVAPDDGRDLSPDEAPNNPCPSETLGGLCLAKTWYGARSGGTGVAVGLLVAYQSGDVLGSDGDNMRVARALTLDVVWLLTLNLSGVNLSEADLSGADLAGVNLSGVNLYRAYLSGAVLSGADLSGADLTGADLSEAVLYGAKGDRHTRLPSGWTVTDGLVVRG